MRWVNSRRSGSVGHEGNEARIQTRDVEKGVRQNRRSDFGRCSAAATVRSEAEDEERSDEQSLPLRHALGKFSSVWISWPRGQRSGDSNPRRGKGGSTKSQERFWTLQRSCNGPERSGGRGAQRRAIPPSPPCVG